MTLQQDYVCCRPLKRKSQPRLRIEHPGVARVLGLLVELRGDAYLVQEFIEGPTLRVIMAVPIERPRAFEILSRIAFGLAAIHAVGVIHRDIKPENIILRSGDAPVLVDFGIAQVAGRKQIALKVWNVILHVPRTGFWLQS